MTDDWSIPEDILAPIVLPAITSLGQFDHWLAGPSHRRCFLLSEAIALARPLGLDPGALFFSLLSTVSAAIPNSLRLRVNPLSPEYTESACIWTMLIGAPGSAKSAYHSIATAPLAQPNAELLRASAMAQVAYRALPKSSRGPEPRDTCLLVENFSVASLRRMLAHNPERLMLSDDEAKDILKPIPSMRSLLNKAYSGERMVSSLISTGTTWCEGSYLPILVSVQTEPLRMITSRDDADGFWQRFVPIKIPFNEPEDCENTAYCAVIVDIFVKEILNIDLNNGNLVENIEYDPISHNTFHFDIEAQHTYDMFCQDIRIMRKQLKSHSNFSNHLSKLNRLAARLAIIIHIGNHYLKYDQMKFPFPSHIDDDTMRLSCLIVSRYVIPHVYAFYQEFFDGLGGDARSAALEILSRKLKKFYPSQLRKPLHTDKAVNALSDANWIRPITPGSRHYEVNPLVMSSIAPKYQREINEIAQGRDLLKKIMGRSFQ